MGRVTPELGVSTHEPALDDRPRHPIVVATADSQYAFDLFQPEPVGGAAALAMPAPAAPAPIVDIADGQFARHVARALETPAPALNLPLGGVAPTAREIASARALMIGWFAAISIAAFAFLSQGPSVTTRSEPPSEPPSAPVETRSLPGDIRLEAPPAKPATARPRKSARDPRPAAPSPAEQPRP